MKMSKYLILGAAFCMSAAFFTPSDASAGDNSYLSKLNSPIAGSSGKKSNGNAYGFGNGNGNAYGVGKSNSLMSDHSVQQMDPIGGNSRTDTSVMSRGSSGNSKFAHSLMYSKQATMLGSTRVLNILTGKGNSKKSSYNSSTVNPHMQNYMASSGM
jgi:hypothetical protein